MGEDKRSGGKQFLSKVTNIFSNFAKGAACFELIPDRRYALMKTARNSHWWEVYDLKVGRRLTAFKTMETHASYMDTYAFPAAVVVDIARISIAIYRDEGIGGSVIKTSASMCGGWVGGYFVAQAGYRAGEYFGGLLGPSQEGVFAVIFGYLGGIIGAQYGDRIARILVQAEY